MQEFNIDIYDYLRKNQYQIRLIDEIDSINKDSDFAYFVALYQCENFIIVDSENNPILTAESFRKTFGYKNVVYQIFSNKDSLNDTYLQARKALYKTYQLIKQEQAEELQKQQQELEQALQGLDSKARESKLQDLQREHIRKQRERERQERLQSRNTNNTNNLILESNDRNNIVIFLDSANSLSNLIHIHNERIDIFTKDSTRLDIQELAKAYQDYGITLDSLHSSNIQIFLYSQLLLGSSESPSNPLFFGELDKEGVFVESKPVYHLIGETDYDTKDSKETFTQTLHIFLNGNTLTLLNYSLLDSSLNIKLECNSSESKEIQEKEKTQREQQKQQESNTKDSIQSTAMLHPILEDDEIKCPHNGVVKLKSNKGKPFTSKGIPMVLESDLLNASIIGCTNPILSGGPCTSVSVILPSARGLKKFNDDYPIMQDLVASGCLTDKGFPLTCTPKENTFRINSPNPSNANTQSKEALLATIKLTKPLLRLYYKEHTKQIDNIPVHRCKINDILQESDTPFGLLELDIHKDSKDLQDTDLQAHLQASYPKDYEFKEIDVTIGIHRLALVFIIRQTIPKVYKQAYKEYEYKEYGVGIYKQLLEYSKDIQHNKESMENQENSLQSIVITHTRVFLAPYGAKKLSFEFANGLDSIIEEKEGVLKIHLINQIVKKAYNG